MKTVYIYGAGGHTKVVLDILKSNDITVPAIFDDNPNMESFMGIPVFHGNIRFPLIVGIGNNKIRKNIVDQLNTSLYSTAVLSSHATVSESAITGCGTVVMQNAVIQSCVKIGRHCIVNTGATIDHDCETGDFVHIAPGSTLCGNVQIGEGSLIGAGTVIIPGVKIGKWSVIGAGSVVVKDIPDGVIAFGSPCKTIKK
jgi:sugar O-acyltransferase (sialic acid O-acetyltransferase NeuD family)